MIRQKVAVLATYAAYPATYGGPIRVLNLYNNLSKYYDVTVLSYDCNVKAMSDYRLNNHFRVICFPPSSSDINHLLDLMDRSGGIFFHDILCAFDYNFSDSFLAALKLICSTADIIISEQPYFIPLIRNIRSNDQIVIHGSQNCEQDLKRKYYSSGNGSLIRKYLSQVAEVESWAVSYADLNQCVCFEDGMRLSNIYSVPHESVLVIQNCSDVSASSPTTSDQRQLNKAELGLDIGPVGIFLGSGYPPNIHALRSICDSLVNYRSDFMLMVVGSISDHVSQAEFSRDVRCIFLGFVGEDEKRALLSAADFALHTITEGSGTNLKLFDYMAAGLPIIANNLGRRGVPGGKQAFVCIGDTDELPGTLDRLWANAEERDAFGLAGRKIAEQEFDWAVAAKRLHAAIQGTGAARG